MESHKQFEEDLSAVTSEDDEIEETVFQLTRVYSKRRIYTPPLVLGELQYINKKGYYRGIWSSEGLIWKYFRV